MRIAVVGALGLPARTGGVNRHCEEVYSRLAARGHTVTLFARRYFSTERECRGIRQRSLRVPRLRGLETVMYSCAASVLAALGPYDVVHYHSIASTSLAFLPRLTGKRVVVTVHSFDWAHRKWGPVARALLKFNERVAARADLVLAVSEALARDLESRYPGLEVQVVRNGLTPPSRPPAAAVRAMGLEAGAYVLFVGRLLPEKGLHVLIDAFGRLEHDADLAVVGEGRYTGSYVRSLRGVAGERVRFLGARSGGELDALYEHARLFVAPSLHEGFNLTVLEAMSHGVCVVASDIDAHAEVLGGAGLLFRSGDPAALAEAMDRALRDDELRVRSGLAGTERSSCGLFDWDASAAKVEALLTSGGRSRR